MPIFLLRDKFKTIYINFEKKKNLSNGNKFILQILVVHFLNFRMETESGHRNHNKIRMNCLYYSNVIRPCISPVATIWRPKTLGRG